MKINGTTEFGIMYRALLSNIDLQKQSLVRVNERILTQQSILRSEIQNNSALIELRKSELYLQFAQSDKTLFNQISEKRLDILWRNTKIQELLKESNKIQDKIDEKRDKITEIKEATLKTTEEQSIKKLKMAFISVGGIIDDAKYAADQRCSCRRSSMLAISRYSSENFCTPPPSSVPASQPSSSSTWKRELEQDTEASPAEAETPT